MSEIVYVLGSGFSVCGGAPTQKDILPFLFSEDFREIGEHKKRIGRFLKDVFCINISNIADLKQFPLEDLFTVLDRTILNQGAFRKYGKSEVDELRKSLGICINFVISNALRRSYPFYSKLGKAILERRVDYKSYDGMAFISLNWDILLDNAIYRAYSGSEARGHEISKCRIDYCCYTTPIKMKNHPHKSIEVKSQGFYNVKVQKLHGSLNWMHCPNCEILYYKMKEKIALWENEPCPNCEATLLPVIIEPTFIKDLNNTHLKMVWHNALLDLIEADRVVFIGYSLPLADFDFRYLLKKGISKKAKIEVVLVDDHSYDGIVTNYKSFFGSQIKKDGFYTCGSCDYLAKEFSFKTSASDCRRYR
jgi:hypothetical protein